MGAQKLWSKQYAWYANENLKLITDAISGVQREFTYDNLNRLQTAQDLAGTSGGTGEIVATSEESEDNALISAAEMWASTTATITPNAVAAPDGSQTATTVTVTAGTTDHWSVAGAANPSLYSGASVAGSVWLRVPSGTLPTYIFIIQNGDQGFSIAGQTAVTLTTTWQKFTVSATLQNGLTELQLQFCGAATCTGGRIYDVWGGQLGPIASVNTVTNILPASQQYTGPSWITPDVSFTSTSIAAPDGSTTATAVTGISGQPAGYPLDEVENPAQYSSKVVTGSVYLRVPSGFRGQGFRGQAK